MRLQWLWLFAAPAILGSVFVPWGEKHIDDHHCQTTWDWGSQSDGERCTSDEWDVAYRPFSLETTHREHLFIGSNAEPVRWAYHYDDAEAPHAEAIGPLLEYGGIALLLGAGAMAVTGILHQVLTTRTTRTAAIAGWSLQLGAIASFILGIAYHAGTWRAEDVDNLKPALGLMLGLIPLLAGVPLLPRRAPAFSLPALPSVD